MGGISGGGGGENETGCLQKTCDFIRAGPYGSGHCFAQKETYLLLHDSAPTPPFEINGWGDGGKRCIEYILLILLCDGRWG